MVRTCLVGRRESQYFPEVLGRKVRLGALLSMYVRLVRQWVATKLFSMSSGEAASMGYWIHVAM